MALQDLNPLQLWLMVPPSFSVVCKCWKLEYAAVDEAAKDLRKAQAVLQFWEGIVSSGTSYVKQLVLIY